MYLSILFLHAQKFVRRFCGTFDTKTGKTQDHGFGGGNKLAILTRIFTVDLSNVLLPVAKCVELRSEF